MFTTLTTDELKSLMAALITKPHGYSSNRMAGMLASSADWNLSATYAAIAQEIVDLHHEVSVALIDSLEFAA